MPQLQQFPIIDAPLVTEERRLTPVWRTFLQSLFVRTGDTQGIASADVAAAASAAQTAANAAQTTATTAQAGANDAQTDANIALGIAQTALQSGNAVAGWAAPTGSGSHATFNMDLALPTGAAYSQAEATAMATQIVVLQKRLGQLELDLLTLGAIKP